MSGGPTEEGLRDGSGESTGEPGAVIVSELSSTVPEVRSHVADDWDGERGRERIISEDVSPTSELWNVARAPQQRLPVEC